MCFSPFIMQMLIQGNCLKNPHRYLLFSTLPQFFVIPLVTYPHFNASSRHLVTCTSGGAPHTTSLMASTTTVMTSDMIIVTGSLGMILKACRHAAIHSMHSCKWMCLSQNRRWLNISWRLLTVMTNIVHAWLGCQRSPSLHNCISVAVKKLKIKNGRFMDVEFLQKQFLWFYFGCD